MKITFIYPDVIGSANYTGIYNIAIGLLSAVLKNHGFDTSLIHITKKITKRQFKRIIEKERADLYAFSCTSPMFVFVKEWAAWIKDINKKSLVIAGGVHAILNPEEVIALESIDFVCNCEGEIPLKELCQAFSKKEDLYNIKGIWAKKNGQIIKNPAPDIIKDLDTIAFADRTLFNYPMLMEGKEQMVFFMASRGCPYHCPYCCNDSIRKSIAECGNWVRFRSVDNVIEEIKSVLKIYPNTKFIGFYDDILALKKDWFEEFTSKYKENINLPFRCNMRANYLADEQVTKMMYEAGCRRVVIGLETGNEYLRNNVLKRNMSNDTLIKAAALCKKYKIEFATFNMLGIPQEKVSQLLDTVKLNAKLRTDFVYASIFYPFKNTQLHDFCVENDLLTETVITDYVEGSCLNFPMSEIQRIMFVRNYFRSIMNIYSLIYKAPKKIKNILEKSVDLFLSSKLMALTVFMFMNKFFSFVRKNTFLAAFINKIKRLSKAKKITSFNTSVRKTNYA